METAVLETTSPDGERLQVVHNEEDRWYGILVDGEFGGLIAYTFSGNRTVFTHTFVVEEFRGRGMAGVLIQGVLDDTRQRQRTITNFCPVVDHWIDRHRDYLELIDEHRPGPGPGRRTPRWPVDVARPNHDVTVLGEQSLFVPAAASSLELDPTGELPVAIDPSFSSVERFELDATSWVDHVHGWLTGDVALMELLMTSADWEQRRRWMYTRVVDEPRLTAEYPRIDDRTHPVLRRTAEVLGGHYGLTYQRLWMNWYRDHNDGTGWHADRPANQFPETVIPVLSLGATRKFLLRHRDGGRSKPFVVAGGDLLIMGGRCQREWVHMVPKQKARAVPRLSLNFSAAHVEERRQRSA